MSVAVVHEWLTTYAGSERVVEQIVGTLPVERMYVLVDHLEEGRPEFLNSLEVSTSFLQRMPLSRSKYRHYLPLMPFAVEQHDVTGHDVVVASQHCVAHGVLTRPDQPLISYVHSPIRYAWDLQFEYLAQSGLTRGPKSWAARAILHYMRLWDRAAAARVDSFVANSRFIASRIRNCYGRDAEVVYPPVATDEFDCVADKEDFYFAASRFVPYKRMREIVRAFRLLPDRKLVVIGDGPQFERVAAEAGPNVEMRGYAPFAELRETMSRARAFVFAAREDFGILPVEAQACGTPVIAYRAGGALETVVDGETGLFFDRQTPEAIAAAVERFESTEHAFDPWACRTHAERFSTERFHTQIRDAVDRAIENFYVRPTVREPLPPRLEAVS